MATAIGGERRPAGTQDPAPVHRRGRSAAGSRRARRGFVSVEFALSLPFVLLLVAGTSDVVGLMRTLMRAETAAEQVGVILSQCTRISAPGDIDVLWTVAQRSLDGFGTVTGPGSAGAGAVIVSAVGRVAGANRVMWQQRTGDNIFTSRVGIANGVATLPNNLQVPAGQAIFVTEVYVRRQTWPLAGWVMGGSATRTLSGMGIFISRAPDAPSLLAAPANSTTPTCTA